MASGRSSLRLNSKSSAPKRSSSTCPRDARQAALAIFKQLDGFWRVFMDHFCLTAGQHWDRVIPNVQAHSRGTIVLVRPSTPNAHFQQSEIHLAINLHRTQAHRIIPIYSQDCMSPPFGLEQIHGIVAPQTASEDEIALLVRDHLRSMDQQLPQEFTRQLI
jgi:hypothetical protein